MSGQGWCGQTQPHGPHTWAQGYIGIYTDCAGHSDTAAHDQRLLGEVAAWMERVVISGSIESLFRVEFGVARAGNGLLYTADDNIGWLDCGHGGQDQGYLLPDGRVECRTCGQVTARAGNGANE